MRGRKRTEDPTPNRARDIQRAFRARRAAHLESLESRIRELEEENEYFRKLLSYPPANRPLLGKGPTGRGVAKSRSRLNSEGHEKQLGSPEPPSDTSSTPPMEYGLSLPVTNLEVYAPLMAGSEEALTPHSVHPSDMKMLNGNPSPEIFHDNILPPRSQHYQETDVHAPVLPFGFSGESPWPIHPDVPVAVDVAPHMETARYYVYSHGDSTNNSQRAVPQSVQSSQFTYGHRRCNTEPDSFGSSMPPFSPTHRNCNSQSFIPVPVHEPSPSPPPLPIRSTVQGFR